MSPIDDTKLMEMLTDIHSNQGAQGQLLESLSQNYERMLKSLETIPECFAEQDEKRSELAKQHAALDERVKTIEKGRIGYIASISASVVSIITAATLLLAIINHWK